MFSGAPPFLFQVTAPPPYTEPEERRRRWRKKGTEEGHFTAEESIEMSPMLQGEE